jgi:hypothetical protein
MYTLILLSGIAIGAIATWRLAMSRAGAWVEGCQQGREDMMSLARALGHKPVPPELLLGDRPASRLPGRSNSRDH